MKNLILISLLAFLTIGVYSCNKDDVKNPTLERLEITSFDVPDTFELGKSYEIGVTYNKPDSCTSLQGFNVNTVDQMTRVIQAIGARNEGESCTGVAIEETNEFLFEVVYDQTYTFKFWQSEDSTGAPQYLTVEVPVK